MAENTLLRQQLIVASRTVNRPKLQPHERGLLVLLARLVPRWRDALLLVKPETVLRWHRAGGRLFWRHRSKPDARREPKLAGDLIALIRRMATSNATWGAERIRGELLKLGLRVSKRTIQKYMRGIRPRVPRGGQRWRTFLRNHTVWACDFVQTYDVWFRTHLRVLHRRHQQQASRAPGGNVQPESAVDGTHPHVTSLTTFGRTWGPAPQRHSIRRGPQFIIRDRDDKYGAEFDRVAKGAGTRVIKTAVRAPLMNSVVERFLRSVRRECLDHVIIVGEHHLDSVLREYGLQYFNTLRPHQGIGQQVPVPSVAPGTACPDPRRVVARPILGGLHHDYQIAA